MDTLWFVLTSQMSLSKKKKIVFLRNVKNVLTLFHVLICYFNNFVLIKINRRN